MGFAYRVWWAFLYIFGLTRLRSADLLWQQREIERLNTEVQVQHQKDTSEVGLLAARVNELQEALRKSESEVAVQKYEIGLLSDVLERDRRRIEAEMSRYLEQTAVATGTARGQRDASS